MKKNLIYLALLLTGGLVSCNKDNSNEIGSLVPFYQNLGVEYDVTHNQTRAGANFKKSDNKGDDLKLKEGSVLINGIEPSFEHEGVYLYEQSFTGFLDVAFTFYRSPERVFVNKVSIDNTTPIRIPNAFTSIDRHGTTLLTWEGKPVAKDEYVVVRLECNGRTFDFYNGKEGERSITISLNNITPTEATLSLSRVTSYPLQQSNNSAGGKMGVSYTVSKKVYIR